MAQQEAKKISGNVKNCDKFILPSVQITNLSTMESDFSDADGNYSIMAKQEDVLVFFCSGFEEQRISVENQIQIDVVLNLIQGEDSFMVRKPVIYLYPTEETEVHLAVDFKGDFLTTFPQYENQWEVTAYPDGRLFEQKTKRFYTSLFWDGNIHFEKAHFNYQEGFVVAQKELTAFLIEKLELLGLNTYETNDFIQYWLPILEKNNLNFIHFRVNADYDLISTNTVTPKPETNIRVFMEFCSLKQSVTIPKQELKATERKGFTLIEWGGCDIESHNFELGFK